jgi:hypothetical protein
MIVAMIRKLFDKDAKKVEPVVIGYASTRFPSQATRKFPGNAHQRRIARRKLQRTS